MRGGREIARFALKLDQGGHLALRADQPYRSVVAVNQAMVEGVLRDKLAELGGEVERLRVLRALEETPGAVVTQIADAASDTIERVEAK
jgi:hypothetical protein